MQVDKNVMQLIIDLEYIIGKECYNPNSYDGYTGEQGREFRYPVWVDTSNTSEVNMQKFSRKISGITPEKISSMKYKFGSNHLYIGSALKMILELLEDRYDIDFSELEEHRSSMPENT